jgi:hypothetical protein
MTSISIYPQITTYKLRGRRWIGRLLKKIVKVFSIIIITAVAPTKGLLRMMMVLMMSEVIRNTL